jgi:hypothetical protein
MDIRGSLQEIAGRLNAARDALVAADVDQVAGIVATIDPTKLALPGILVQFAGLDLDTLAGHTVLARVLVVAPQRDDPRSLDTLNHGVMVVLAANLEVTAPITSAGVRVPKHPKPMPGLSVPVQIHETE